MASVTLQELAERQSRQWAFNLVQRMFAALLLVAALSLLVLAIWAGFVSGIIKRQTLPPVGSASEMQVTFGFERASVVRNFAADIQPVPRSGGTAPNEETIVVRLASDLRNTKNAAEFPADQLSIGVTRLSTNRVNLTVTANPWAPERVRAGTYTGTVQLRGATIRNKDVPIRVSLLEREDGAAALAFVLLVGGGLTGLLVKFITDRLTPKAQMVRRLAGLKTIIGYQEDMDTLPVADRLAVRNLEDQINREDYAAVDASFKTFEAKKELLALISSRARLLLRQLFDQGAMLRGPLRDDAEFLLNAVIDSEYRQLQLCLGQQRQTRGDQTEQQSNQKEGQDESAWYRRILEEIDNLSIHAGTITNLIDDFLKDQDNERLRLALSEIRAGDLKSGIRHYASDTESSLPPEAVPTPGRFKMPRRRRLAKWLPRPESGRGRATRVSPLFRYARAIAGVASVVVVSLVGLKLQYLDNQNFAGGLTSWLTLVLWAAAVELSGVSVLEVVGRLGSSGAATTSGAP